MENTIATQNAQRLARLSSVFCLINGLEPTAELARILTNCVMSGIARWYAEQGRTFNPQTEVIEDDAIAEAFARCQEIAILAQVAAQTGIGMEGLTD